MNREVHVREARCADAEAISRIGLEVMPLQYAGLVDPAAVQAAIDQTYAVGAVEACISRCRSAEDGHFLVAEADHAVVGFLHFDAFGPEPELHRLYVDPRARGAGIGGALMRVLHEELRPPARYMLLVVAGNDRAVTFYQRHGLEIAERVDGLAYYRERMGVEFPPSTRPFDMVLMRRR